SSWRRGDSVIPSSGMIGMTGMTDEQAAWICRRLCGFAAGLEQEAGADRSADRLVGVGAVGAAGSVGDSRPAAVRCPRYAPRAVPAAPLRSVRSATGRVSARPVVVSQILRVDDAGSHAGRDDDLALPPRCREGGCAGAMLCTGDEPVGGAGIGAASG